MALLPSLRAARRHGTLGAGGLAHFVHDGISDSLYVLLPLWAEAFGLSLAQVGFLKSAFSSALAALQLPMGLLAERVGERILLALGTALAGLGLIGLALADGFWALLVGLVVVGLASSVQHPLASAIISRGYQAARRRAALGTYNFAGDLGKVALPPAVAAGAVLLTWQGSLVAFGLLVVGVGGIVLVALRRLEAGGPSPRAAERPADQQPSGWGIRAPWGFSLLSAIGMIDSICRMAVLTFVPFVLLAKGADIAWVGFALALLFAGGAAGKLICGLIAERVGVIRLVLLTELATAAGIAAVLALPLGGALAVLPALGIALNGTSSVLYGTIGDFVEPARQSRAFGLFYTLGIGAGALSPVTFGAISDAAGVDLALSLVAGLVLVTLPLAIALGSQLHDRG